MKQVPSICSIKEKHFRSKDTNRLKAVRREKINHANSNHEQVGEAALISDKRDFEIGAGNVGDHPGRRQW